ncbi:non-ribosomal peptide synthase domain TIGR01720/amino acid adenylation domain-containing protein [Stigmatella aurantiaca]|uniref:Non-ribosomal peptide synthase domain TIGR01720/amino acid adenylation domain-containing protein n=1 Tax=Stigmatella aurantiaca TaxID=41 RepID=A0A1H8EIB7_STIAU|nr:non-ribosomal peptide synthase domain TIGR01720/amino acid adenylation domain-containing protein [Stigmatella aurantiaca]
MEKIRDRKHEEGAPASLFAPCSWVSEHFSHSKNVRASAFSCVQGGFRISGTLDVPLLEQSFDVLTRRHPSLRAPLSLTVIELPQAGEAECRAVALEQAQRPFDPDQGPLLRAALLRLGIQEHVLLLCMHQLVADEASPEVLGHELATVYGALVSGTAPRLLEPSPYGEFARNPKWNEARVIVSADECAHQLFEEQVKRTPQAVAVSFEGTELSYAELDGRANQLAQHLRGMGVGPESRVGLCVERSVELVVGMLGTLKAGGAYVPLDPAAPAERLEYMMKDAGLEVLLTQQRLVPGLPVGAGHVVCLDADWAQISRQSQAAVAHEGSAGQLAYVIYTSGSTGKPKGTLLEHGGLCNAARAAIQILGLGPGKKVLQFSSLGFDASVWEMFSALLSGAHLVLASKEALMPGAPLQELLQAQAITTATLTPSVLMQLEPGSLPSLETVAAAGEACTPELVGRWKPGRRFINAYGPTEVTICATQNSQVEAARPTIGRALPNVQVYVLDEAQRVVPVGVAGELCVGGAGLARGYLGRAELTAERFIPNPYSEEPGARLYRTGDRVRWLENGELEFLGRMDFQVKLRGFRIELEEVEAALSQQAGLSEVVVVVREDVPGVKRLVAYVVGAGKQPAPSSEALRSALKQKLPEYMVPSAFVRLEALPLALTGKVDRKALPAPDWNTLEPEREYVAPQTPVEKELAAIWAKVLRLERVGRHDNFFLLGGDSIIGMQILARAHQAGLRFTSKQLFQHPTLAALAPLVTQARDLDDQGVITGRVSLTPIQHWFLEQQQPEPHHFKQAMVFEVTEPVAPALLEQALRQLLAHHDALRMCFTEEGGRWQQSNGAQAQGVSLRQVDLAHVPEAQRATAIEAVSEELQEGFDLSQGLLLRAALLHLGAGQTGRLLLAIHHFVVDFVSWRILLEDLNTAYQQLCRGEPVVLAAKTTSFKRWAGKLEEYAQSPLEEDRAYWLQPREPVRALPVDRVGGANTQESARGVTVSLDVEPTRALLQEVPGAYRAHINDVLLAVLAQSLAQWTGSRQVLVDLEGHGREELFEDVNLSRTVGWFTTLFPVQLDLPEATSPAPVLESVREELRRLPHRGIGYGLLRYLRKDGAAQGLLSRPQAEVSFNYWGQIDLMGQGSAPFVLSSELGGPEFGRKHRRPHLLAVEARVFGGKLEVTWLYSENVHARATVEALAQNFMASLRTLIAGRTSPEAARYIPSDFPLAQLDRAALEQVLKQTPRIEDLYPLAPLQQGLLYHAHLAPGTDLYFEQVSWAIPQALDVSAFQKAWERVVAQSPVLRTVFLWEGLAEPLQAVLPSVTLPWQQLDWRGVPAAEQKARLSSLVSEDRSRGFELSQAPLMRVALIRLGEASYHCLFSFHHLLLDGWSVGLVFQALYAHYEALSSGKELPLQRGTSYRDYIAWLRQQDVSRSEAYWRQALKRFTTPSPLPYGQRPGWTAETSQGYGEQQLQIGRASADALQAFVRQHGLTLNTLVLGAWGLVLGQHGGSTDVVFGTTLAGRPPELPGSDAVMGLLINTLPARVRLESQVPVLPWLERLQAEQDELRQHEYSPLAQVQAWSEVPRGTGLFESLYSFENYPMDSALGGAEFIERTQFAIAASVIPNRQGLLLRIAFEAGRFESATIDRLLAHWSLALERMVAQPEKALGRISLLSEGERRQVLEEWAATALAGRPEACAHQLFEEQVKRTPQAVAVSFEGAELSYAELDGRANQLAQHLRGMGVGPESRVGLCVERSVELVVGMLGTLKAGGAYVPLDPAAPAERLEYMMKDAGLEVLLTQQRLVPGLPVRAGHVVCLDADWAQISRQSQAAVAHEGSAG